MILHEVMPYHPTSYLTFEPSERSRATVPKCVSLGFKGRVGGQESCLLALTD